MTCLRLFFSFFVFLVVTLSSQAQYKLDHIPGFVGLESGTQAPPGLYVGDLLYVYPTSEIKDSDGNSIHLPGSLTSTADVILVTLVPDFKILGAHVGASIGFPWIKNRIQLNSLALSTNFAFTDMFGGVSLGWHFKRADVTTGYNLYMPSGRFSPGGSGNTGLGMWGNEFTIGSTVYLDQKKLWNAAATFALEFNTDKSGTNIHPGNLGTVEGGVGRTFYKKVSGPIPIVMNFGAAYYAQFKVTGDSGSDIPPPLRGFMDRVLPSVPNSTSMFRGRD